MASSLLTNGSTRWIHLLFRGEKRKEEDQVQHDKYIDEFESRNLFATTIPILQFNYINLDKLSNILHETKTNQATGTELEPDPIYGLVITSPRAAEALRRSIEWANETSTAIFKKFNPEYVFVVGDKSGQECESSLGIKYNNSSAQSGSGRSLAEYIKNYCKKSDSRKIQLLYPKGNLADHLIEEVLADEDKIELKPIVVYETNIIDDLATIAKEKFERLKIPDGYSKLIMNAIFFSPSGVESFLKMDQEQFISQLKLLFSKCDIELKYSSIGEKTKASLLRNNFNVFCVSEKPNPKSLVDCVLRATLD